MEDLVKLLEMFHFTKNETLAYLNLYQKQIGNGYEISKASGIPRSKIYSILKKLEQRGVVFSSGEDNGLYTALSKEELIEKLRRESNSQIDKIANNLNDISDKKHNDNIWSIDNLGSTIDKAKYLVANAKNKLLIQIWQEDIDQEFLEVLVDAEARIDEFVLILFSDDSYNLPFSRYYKHHFENYKKTDYGGRWINVVKDDEALYGKLGDELSVISTKNKSITFIAEEYILHDAYNLRCIDEMRVEAQKYFGQNLDGIREVYREDERGKKNV